MGLTRFILIFIKLFWVLKLLYGFSQIQKHTYVELANMLFHSMSICQNGPQSNAILTGQTKY